jgi:hypothetical protein
MANIPDVNFNKIPDKSVKFNQNEYYESNFDKINEQIVPKVNELDDKVNIDIPSQLADIDQEKVQNFKLKNEVVNGDFSQGTTGWMSHGGATISLSNDECKITTAVNQYGSAKQIISLESLTNKYYVHVKTRQLSGVPQKILIQFGAAAFQYIPTIDDSIIYALSTIFSGAPSTQVTLYIGKHIQPDIFDIYIDKVIGVDLTKTFGAGNEPTNLEMDELMKVIPNQWFDGELSLTQKQVVTWQLNLIRKNTNAIIALGGTI